MQCCGQGHAGIAQQQRTVVACSSSIASRNGGKLRSSAIGTSYMLQWPSQHRDARLSAGGCLMRQQRPRQSKLSADAGPSELTAAEGRKKLAVFVSGGGSNFRALHAACLKGDINADIVAVVSDVPSCGGVAYAKEQDIAILTYPASRKGLFPGLSKEELVQQMSDREVDYVLLAGYLKLVPEELVGCYKRRMLNIHPGLLPSFGGHGMYGQRVHEAVIQSGARFSGPTVHFVDQEYDTGPILAQRCVPVCPTDSPKRLAARVLEQEHQVYPFAVAALVDGRITWREDGIPIIWEAC